MAEPTSRRPSNVLADGLRALFLRPVWTVVLLILGTMLAQLGPALELLAKGDANPLLRIALTLLANMPFLFICIPLWISRLDAELKNLPANPKEGWPGGFDRRWSRAVGPAISLLFFAWFGCALIIPGAAILAFAGFAPTRMILRDESFTTALRWNATSMAKHWQKVIPSVLGILIVMSGGVLGLLMMISGAVEGQGAAMPTARFLLTNHLIWLAQGLQMLLLLFLFGMLLSVYHKLEALSQSPSQDQSR